jgi:NADH-quinone oxidoreductase subunit J
MTLYVLLILLLLLVLGIGFFKDLLYGAICLALASVVLAGILFMNGAWVAAVFELSVCAGLIFVLFVASISLTKDSDQKEESKVSPFMLPAFLLIFLGLDFFAMNWIGSFMGPGDITATHVPFRETFWGLRATDVLGQVSLILAGVFAILALFKRTAHGRKHD